MSLSGTLMIGTGILHCGVGFLIPELSAPLMRTIQERTLEVSDINERYARECSFWFQMGGVMFIVQGMYMRSYSKQLNGRESPPWFGWTLMAIGGASVAIMPQSGFWLILAQGARIVWLNHRLDDSEKKTT